MLMFKCLDVYVYMFWHTVADQKLSFLSQQSRLVIFLFIMVESLKSFPNITWAL